MLSGARYKSVTYVEMLSLQVSFGHAPGHINEEVRKIMQTYGGRGTLSDGSQPLAPEEALKSFKLREGLAIDLVAAEPAVRQPLYMSFDSRGRLWVTQYIQYQYPAGLKVVSYDQHLRAVSGVNPTYASLRDAAWAQMQATGQAADPRLRANLERARLLPAKGRYILVDAASARLWMYEDGKEADSMKVIVGKRSAQTPMIASTISYATFNPYWNIPTDVAKRVHAPEIVKRGAAKYLKNQGFEVASDWTDDATIVPPEEVDWKAVAAGDTQVRIRQLPGKNNMMGAMKFSFPNSTGIYLHDTPQKGLFAKEGRKFSLGCVRVEDAERLGRWLLGRDPVAPSDAPEQHVQLPSGVPIYITYLTAHAEAGQLTFADDVYGLDRSPASEVAAAR